MKNASTSLLILWITLSFTTTTLSAQSLIGKWKGEDGGEVGIITFDKEGYVAFTVNGESIGGKAYKVEGMVFDMVYEIDDTVTPHTMDFVISMDGSELEVSRMEGIYRFDDDKTLVINMKFDGSGRPEAFDDSSDDQIRLTKTKKKK